MNKKFLVAIVCVLTIIAAKAHAQGVVFVAQDTPSHPEVLIHIPPTSQDNVIIQDAVFTENSASDAVAPSVREASVSESIVNKNISYYVQNLDLSPEQISKAQEISNVGHAKQEELLRNIESLRAQAHEIENDTLADFEAILSDEQKAEFYKLKTGQDVLASQPEPQPAEVQSEPQPEEVQPEPQPSEVQLEPQPAEVQPEPQPAEVQLEPQPAEVQSEPQPAEVQPEPQPAEVQPEPQPEEVQPEPQPAEVKLEPQPVEAQPEPQPAEVQPEPQPAEVQ